jgi:hypothetical protein
VRLLAAWLLALLLCGVTWADETEDSDDADGEFVVTKYDLAFVNVAPGGEITNEYVPEGETLERWTTLIGVRVWPKAEELGEIVGPYVRALEPVMVREASAYETPGSEPGTDVVFELYLAPADRSYLEYNLIRFTQEEGTDGVKSYQFAIKGAFDLDAAVKEHSSRLESRLEVIGGLELEAYTEQDADEEDEEEQDDDSGSDDEEEVDED